MGKPELKPCPFCGSDAYFDKETAAILGNRTGHKFAIACSWCEISGPGEQEFNKAVMRWNQRLQ